MVYPKLCVMINLMSFQHKLHASNYMEAMNLIHIPKDMNVTMKISGQTIFNVLEQRQVNNLNLNIRYMGMPLVTPRSPQL
jgi:hypothetical protein